MDAPLDIVALVMAGGGGARLWPVSRAGRPKHLLTLPAGERPLVAAAVERARAIAGARVFVVTTEPQAEAVRAASALDAERIIREPRARNTAACVALGLSHVVSQLRAQGLADDRIDRAILLILPADHHVGEPGSFREALRSACARAGDSGGFATLGIRPLTPETGYGYIERDEAVLAPCPGDRGLPAHCGRRFVEKPDLARAEHFVASGRFLWNAGIFAAPVASLRAALAEHAPELVTALSGVESALAAGDPAAARAEAARAYAAIEPLPIDIAVMERLASFTVIPTSAAWTDLGSWAAVHRAMDRDARDNATRAAPGRRVALIDGDGCLVWTEDASVALVGARGLAVVCSGGRVLVCPLDRAQEARAAARRLDP